MESDLVSIIMPSYNSASTIGESIESVLKQKYANWELLITDDCSSDDTVSIVNEYAKLDPRISLAVLEKNAGAGVARNNSIELAKGRFVAFLDADDIWHEDKLLFQIEFMKKNNVELSYTYYQKFSGNSGDGGVIRCPAKTTYDKLLYSNVIGCLTAVYDTKKIGKQFMPTIRKRQDMGLWLKILKLVDDAECVPLVLAKYRVDSGMTANKFKVLSYQWQFYRSVIGLPLCKAVLVFCIYSYRGLIKSRV